MKSRFHAIRWLPCPEPASALLFPVAAYPIAEPERYDALNFMLTVSHALASPTKLLSEIFLHLIPSKNATAGAMLSPNAKGWMLQPGLGVWPNRKPPAMWTKEDFENLEPGHPPQDNVYPVFRVSKPGDVRERARAIAFGQGALIEILTSESGKKLTGKGTTLLLPTISEPAFRCFPYYLPLLDAAAVASASFLTLQSWLCGAAAYLRESIDDQGLLVISLEPLGPVLDSLGAVSGTGPATLQVPFD